jgi:hypothetical protein
MIQIDTMEILLNRLQDRGWLQNRGYTQRGNPRVLERNGTRIAVIKPIKIDPFKGLATEVDKFFRSLICFNLILVPIWFNLILRFTVLLTNLFLF